METMLKHFHITRRVLLLSLAVIVPLLVDQHIGSLGPESKFRFLELGVLFALLLGIPVWIASDRRVRITMIHTSIVLAVGYALLRAMVDPFPSHAMDYALQQASWMGFILLTASVCRTPGQFRRFLWIAVPAQLVTVVYAFGQTYQIDLYFKYILKRQDWFWFSPNIDPERALIFAPLGQPNYYANYGAIVLLFLITLLCQSRGIIQRLAIGAITGLLFYTLLYTFTRGIWVSLVPAIAAVIGVESIMQLIRRQSIANTLRQMVRPVIYAGGIALLLILTLGAYEWHQGDGPLHKIGKRFSHGLSLRDTSLRTRPLLWYATLGIWKDAPVFGQGNGQYAPRYLEEVYRITQEYDPYTVNQITAQMNALRSEYTHNDYLQTLAEQGLIGLSCWVLLFLSAIGVAIYLLWYASLAPPDRITLLGCLTIAIQTALQSFYDFSLRLPASALFFALAIAGIMVYARSMPALNISFSVSKPVRWLVSICGMAVCVYFGVMIVNHFKASHLRNAGIYYLQERYLKNKDLNPVQAVRDLKTAERYLTASLELYPHQGLTLHNLGRTHYFFYHQDPNLYYPRLKQARDAFEQARNTFSDPETWRMLCTVYLEEKRYTAAALLADRLLAIDPTREEAQYFAGLIDFHAGNFSEAVQHFQAEIQTDQEHPFSYIYLARAFEGLKQYGAAARTYESFLDRFPHWIDPRLRLGDVYARHLNDPIEARGHYQTALELSRHLQGHERSDAVKAITDRLQQIEEPLKVELE